MNLFGFHVHLPAAAAPVAAAAAAIAPAALPRTTEAVVALAKSPVGAAVAADIKAVADQSLTGAQKRQQVVSNTIPLLVDFLGEGGVKATADEVTDTAHLLVQSVYNDTHSETAGTLAVALLSLATRH